MLRYSLIFVIVLLYSCKQNHTSNLNSTSLPEQYMLADMQFIDSTIINFGNINKSDYEMVSRKYHFVNTSDKPLILEDIYSSCNCTEAIVEQKIINPGDTSYVQLNLDTRSKHGFTRIYAVMQFNTKQQMYKVILQGEITD